ncbi:MAG: rRNA pseudouridine synthase [Treponema sp.]|nr:rRNA pseudouridine synthase [Treponema sp.]
MKMQRIDKILSHHGFGSRKDVKKLLRTGCVLVNDIVCYDSDKHIDTEFDIIKVDDKILEIRTFIYIMMNKCADMVCSNKDGLNKTVFDLLDEKYTINFMGGTLHTVGRLDIDTEGLLILTNDGALTHRLTSPKTDVPKTYFVKLRNFVDAENQKRYTKSFKTGINVPPEGKEEGFLAKSAQLNWISENEVEIIITEGKYHQVKRMFAQMNNEVIYLKRIKIANLCLDKLIPCGGYREMTKKELELL